MSLNKNKLFYCFVNGLFDYCRSENIRINPNLISFDLTKNIKTDHGFIGGSKYKILGVAGSTITGDGILYLIGAIEVSSNKRYDKLKMLNNKGFELALIEINTNNLKYE